MYQVVDVNPDLNLNENDLNINYQNLSINYSLKTKKIICDICVTLK